MCGTERLLEKMKELYISYRQRYVLCLPNGRIITPKHRDGTWCSLSDNVIRNHLEHKYAIAVFAGREGSRFMCFDVDDGSKETVRLLIDRLDAMGIPRRKIHVSFSGSKGYHVELFFGGVIRTDILLNLYRHVMDACHLDQKKVEFRPTDRAAIKLPLSVHPKSGKMCWYVEAASMKEICTPDYLLGIEPLNAREQQALFSLPLLSPAKHTLRAEADGGGGARSPAETRRLGTTLAQAGTRHNMMRNIAVFERAHGSSEEACRKRLEEWYAGQDRSLIRSTPAQVYQDMDELVAWVYSERFNAAGNGCSRGAAYLYANQMEMVLAQPTRMARR